MTERIHRVLDGELPRDVLSPEEKQRLAELEAAAGAVTRAVDRAQAPDLVDCVMSRIGALPAPSRPAAPAPRPALSRLTAWLWTPRPVALRPAWGVAAAALVVALVALPFDRADEPTAAVTTPPVGASAAEVYVHFRLDAPDASSVHLAGDFTDWQPAYELHEIRPGIWTVIVPLKAGVHDYAFVVDGERWTPDPAAAAVDDGFGGQNSRLSLLPPERTRA